jgi:hypothetical protein
MTTLRKFSASTHSRWTALGLACATLVACGGGGGGSTGEQGTLKLAMTDAPACGYEHVYVTVTKVRVHQSASAGVNDAGWSELVIAPRRIDLLALTNGVLQELGSLPLPAGSYQQVRLVLAENPGNPTPANPLANALVLANTSSEIALNTPSGQQSGFKLQAHFDVTGGQVADLVLDFDACKSIVQAGKSGNYNLKPVVAVIKRLTTAIVGYVHPSIAAGVVVSARDPDNNLRATVPDASGKFTLAYLPENTSYTVVVAGQNLTTAAITGVPVTLAAGTTQLNTASAPIAPPVSTTAGVTGMVKNAGGTALTEAGVSARQSLSTGALIDVAWTAVDPASAVYNLTLPLLAPVRAPYVPGGSLVFATDAAALPGVYSVVGSAPGYSAQITPAATTLGAAGSSTVKDLVLAP